MFCMMGHNHSIALSDNDKTVSTTPLPSLEALPFNNTQHTDGVKLPTPKLLIILMYSVMSLAIFFNLRVIYIVVSILCKRQTTSPARQTGGSNQHAFVYVLSLSIVDSMVLAHLPLVIVDMVIGEWIFGTLVCKLYYIAEQVNGTLSTFVLTALSGDRFLAVCFPVKFRKYRTTRAATLVITICVFMAALLLTPYFIYTEVVTVNWTTKELQKCHFGFESHGVSIRYTIAIFVLCYALPFLAMVFFYGSILFTLWTRNSTSAISNSTVAEVGGSRVQRGLRRAQHVTQRALILVLFYFGCWTPYWAIQFYVEFILDQSSPTSHSPALITTVVVLHSLRYLNSAVNPFLYSSLNKQLQQQHSSGHPSERTSFHMNQSQRQQPRQNQNHQNGKAANESILSRFFPNKRRSVEQDPNEMPLLTQSTPACYTAVNVQNGRHGRPPDYEE